jgi:hypothetical protein
VCLCANSARWRAEPWGLPGAADQWRTPTAIRKTRQTGASLLGHLKAQGCSGLATTVEVIHSEAGCSKTRRRDSLLKPESDLL